ncbi:unnamed protein product, partial [Brenthis ino]
MVSICEVCSESSASESSLESSSGYGSQGAFAAEDHAHQHNMIQHADVESEIVTLRRDDSIATARENFSISLGSLEEAVRSLDEAVESPTFATIGKKPAVPKRRPVSMSASVWSRRGSSSSVGKPPPPVRRSSSISRPQRPPYHQNVQNPVTSDADNLPPPPAFLLQPESDNNAVQGINVAETVKQLTELKHMPASPGLVRRMQNQNQIQNLNQNENQNQIQNQKQNINQTSNHQLSTFQQAKSNFSSTTSLNNSGSLNPIYGQTKYMYVENSMFARKNSLNSSNTDLYGSNTANIYGESKGSPHGSTPSTPSYGETTTFSSFGPRVNSDSHYGQTGFKLQQDKYTNKGGIYAQPALSAAPLARRLSARSHSAERHHVEHGGLIASLSAKLAPQLSPRTTRRTISSITCSDSPPKGKGAPAAAQPAFLDKLSATLQQRLAGARAAAVRDRINAHAQPDPRVCHTSLMEQIKRGATLRRNKYCNDRSAPKIR